MATLFEVRIYNQPEESNNNINSQYCHTLEEAKSIINNTIGTMLRKLATVTNRGSYTHFGFCVRSKETDTVETVELLFAQDPYATENSLDTHTRSCRLVIREHNIPDEVLKPLVALTPQQNEEAPNLDWVHFEKRGYQIPPYSTRPNIYCTSGTDSAGVSVTSSDSTPRSIATEYGSNSTTEASNSDGVSASDKWINPVGYAPEYTPSTNMLTAFGKYVRVPNRKYHLLMEKVRTFEGGGAQVMVVPSLSDLTPEDYKELAKHSANTSPELRRLLAIDTGEISEMPTDIG